MELLAAAFIVLGLVAIIARFSSGVMSGRTRLPAVIDRSIGMWVVRRIRGELVRGPASPATRTPPSAKPAFPLADGDGPESAAAFSGTPERLVAVGVQRAVPAPLTPRTDEPAAASPETPSARPMPPLVRARPPLTDRPPFIARPPSIARPSAGWWGRVAEPAVTRVAVRPAGPAAAPRRSLRATLQTQSMAVVGTALTIGLIGLIAIAALIAPGRLGGGPSGPSVHPAASPAPTHSPRPSG